MLVKVWNDNVHPYAEKFRGDEIKIAPHDFVEMEFHDASQFLGQMPPNIEVDANGKQKATSFKKLRIEKIDAKAVDVPKKFVCMIDGKEFQSQSKLDAYIKENHMDSIADEDSREAFKKGKVKSDTSRNRNSREAKV